MCLLLGLKKLGFGIGIWAQGLGFKGSGFRVEPLGFRDLGLRVEPLGFRMYRGGLGLRV
jgi:hypothetical protein